MKSNQTERRGPTPICFTASRVFGVLLALVGLLAISPVLQAQYTGEIEGKIVEDLEGDKFPVPYANVVVEVNGVPIGAVSDENGRFTIKPLNPGYYDVRFTAMMKDTVMMKGVRVSSDKITRLGEVSMSTSNMTVYEVLTWNVPLIDAEDPSRMELLWEDIEKSPALRNPTDLIANFSSEISTNQDGELYFRGSRSTDVVYFVDGVKGRDGSLGMPSAAIGGMQVYTGGLPARYGDVTGGAVIVETKSYFDLLNAYKRRTGKQ